MSTIIPCLWFNNNAEKAVRHYTSLFANAHTGATMRYDAAMADVSGQPEGSVLTVEFTLFGQSFIALNGGPMFQFSPAVSFFVECSSVAEIDKLWAALSKNGSVLMKLGSYPFSEHYGWLTDEYGVSWQFFLAKEQKIIPCLMFTKQHNGEAASAIALYTKLLDGKTTLSVPYEPGEGNTGLKHARFTVHGQEFIAMDGGTMHAFTFTQAISFIVNCHDQKEIDHLWKGFATGGQEQPCGWVLDRYGVAWQIVPANLSKLLQGPGGKNATQAMLEMKKLNIAALEHAAKA